jgi:[ribosomal protein S18]-alanine N-acetyltransferase
MAEGAAPPRVGVRIYPMNSVDLPAVLEIERSAFSTPWQETTFRALLLRSDTDVFAAFRDDRLVGYGVCWTVADQAELGNVAVAATERGGGVGRALVAEAVARTTARGARELFLEVRESNEVARGLYGSCGFRPVGRRRAYYTRPVEDALVLRRELEPDT